MPNLERYRCGRLVRTAIVILAQTALWGHDMWIEPGTFSPVPGDIVSVRLRVGQNLLGDPLPRDPALVKAFLFQDAAGRKPVIGRDGADPAGFLRVAAPGLVVIGYTSNPSATSLPPEKFNRYLAEEGLDEIAALRAGRHQMNAPARELFVRCAKSLLFSGPGSGAQRDRALGFTLELLAERNPYAVGNGREIPIRLTHEGRPLKGALVVALNRLNPGEKLSARTGEDGRVHFRLHSGGMWLVKAVHMVPAPAGSNSEWLSYWASLTFERRE